MDNFTVKRFGSFWMNGLDRKGTGAVMHQNGAIYQFGDTTGSDEVDIPWVWVDGRWFSTVTVLTYVSWNELNKQSYTTGRPICIDDQLFLCRCPKLANHPSQCEFRRVIAASGKGDEFWHWAGYCFWGDKQFKVKNKKGKEYFASWINGMYTVVDKPQYLECSERNCFVGFRPVLEPVLPRVNPADHLLGRPITVWTKKGKLEGILEDFNQYDLVLRSDHFEDIDQTMEGFALKCNRSLLIDREAIIYIDEHQ